MRPGLWVILALVALIISACMRPYARSELDPAEGHFNGITAYWGQSSSSHVRVLFVHGMCTHTEDGWVTHGWDQSLQGYFGIAATDVKTLPNLANDYASIVQRDYRVGASTLSARYLIWSSLTASDKAAIQFDDPPPPGAFSWKRATLNGELKIGLLNDCLSDAVIYAGARGPTLALAIRNGICVAFDGTVSPRGCTFPDPAEDAAPPLILVTESLGSRMVFDALAELEAQARARGEAALAGFDRAVAPVSEVFMLANQIPLLGLAESAPTPHPGPAASATTAPSSALIRGVQTIAAARERQRTRSPHPQGAIRPPPPITIVAFTDPNDLLSYRLAPESLSSGPLVEVVNVITSNDGALLGYVENPMSAHTGYRTNPDVLKLLFGGSDRSAVRAGANVPARASAVAAAHSR